MLEYGQMIASLCAGVSVMFATLVIVEFTSFVSARYKEKYLRETAVELDDVLLQMPAGRIFDNRNQRAFGIPFPYSFRDGQHELVLAESFVYCRARGSSHIPGAAALS